MTPNELGLSSAPGPPKSCVFSAIVGCYMRYRGYGLMEMWFPTAWASAGEAARGWEGWGLRACGKAEGHIVLLDNIGT